MSAPAGAKFETEDIPICTAYCCPVNQALRCLYRHRCLYRYGCLHKHRCLYRHLCLYRQVCLYIHIMGWWTILISELISSGREWVDWEQMEHSWTDGAQLCSLSVLKQLFSSSFLSVFMSDWDPNSAWNKVLYVTLREHDSWLQLFLSVF